MSRKHGDSRERSVGRRDVEDLTRMFLAPHSDVRFLMVLQAAGTAIAVSDRVTGVVSAT